MVGETWSSNSKICDACKTARAAVFCRPDSAFLCTTCDANIHAANKLASRHARVFLCDVCEQAPASVTCKADAAALCAACDRDIHSVNPLARRHDRLPVVPFFNADSAMRSSPSTAMIGDEFSEEEAEAASWLIHDPNTNKVDDESESPEYESAEYLFGDLDPACLDLDLISKNGGMKEKEEYYHSCDGVVPVHECKMEFEPGPVVDGFPTCEVGYPGSKSFTYNFTSQSISRTVSASSSLDVGLVPDHNRPMANAAAANTFATSTNETSIPANPVSGLDREARVLRYREKRKNRRFEKTIRYASRKAYAETRPRIKGRFAKRSDLQLIDSSYCLVPTF
ncbi:zinc finger protein CONSTANS-LIKE 3 [Henckelia pumila]|uniref:zinc finger protein CONSTANS-LIKE 3 n=1 Tax=Henckelia pumila TaxID=405737 RepID=UPI003C6E095A